MIQGAKPRTDGRSGSLLRSGLTTLAVLFASLLFAPVHAGATDTRSGPSPAGSAAQSPGAGISVIGGTETPISEVPWPVALVANGDGSVQDA